MKNKLIEVFKEEKFYFNDEQIMQFVYFSSMLKEWNKIMNLTALDSDDDIIYKHFLDSLLCLKVDLEWHGKKVIDIGTGAGFPGIPLKIALNNINLFLFDSLKKRISFLEKVVEVLQLENVQCLHGRAEDLAKNYLYRETYDIVVARAVARLPVLLELCLPFVTEGGFFMALKGPEGLVELKESNHALNILGAEVYKIYEFFLKDINHKRILIIFKKISSTPLKFPRKAGIPQKRPLMNT